MRKKYIYNNPLSKLILSGKVFRNYGIFTLKQIYNNVNDIELQSVYYFKIPKDTVLKDFKIITVNADCKNEMLFSKTIEHHKAQRLFDAANLMGDSGVILQSLKNNAYKLTIGRQLIGEKTEIHVTYYWEFDIGEVDIITKLEIPLAVEVHDVPEGEEHIFVDEIDYTMELDLELVDNENISQVSCATHDIKLGEDGKFTVLNFANESESLVCGELIIEITYNALFDGGLRYYITDDGKFMQEIQRDGEIHYIRSTILEFLHYGQRIRELENSLHNVVAIKDITEINAEILHLALKHNILCSKTSLFAKREGGKVNEISAVHKLSVPILKKPFVFDKIETSEELAISMQELAALQRSNGVIADEYEYELDVCANSTAAAITALISIKEKNTDKYLQFSEEYLSVSLGFLIKYLAEGGELTNEIRICFKNLLEKFIVSGEQAKILQKIVEF